MAEDPFGRKGEQQDPFGAGATPPPSWAPPVAPVGAAAGPAPGSPAAGPGGAPTPGKATAALVLGILGLPFFCPVLCSIPALILGYQARREIDASNGTLGGRGSAQAAIIMGWVSTGLAVLAIVAIVIVALVDA